MAGDEGNGPGKAPDREAVPGAGESFPEPEPRGPEVPVAGTGSTGGTESWPDPASPPVAPSPAGVAWAPRRVAGRVAGRGPAGPDRRLVAVIVIGGLLLGMALGIGAIETGLVRGGGRETAAAPTSTETVRQRDAAISTALTVMQEAVRDGDEAAYLSVVDPSATAFRAHQQQVFRNLRTLGEVMTLNYAWDRRTLPVPASRPYSGKGVVAAVTVTHSFTDYDARPVTDVVGLSFVPVDGHWYLTSDSDADDRLALGGQYEPWAFGEISLIRSEKVLVVGDPGHEAQDRKLLKRLESALGPVRSMWPSKVWNGRVVVYASTDPDFVTSWFGENAASGANDNPSGEATFEAKVRVLPRRPVVSDSDPYLSGSPRLVVTPSLLDASDAYSRPVLRHELTHVALAGVGDRRPSTWLVEGAAEYTGFRRLTGSGAVNGVGALARRGLSRDTWSRLKQGTWKSRLISDDNFYTGTETEVDDAYTTAWFTCLYIADHFGEAKLRDLYTTMATSPESLSDTEAETAALKEVLSLDRSTLQTRVRSYARRLRTNFV